VTSAAGSSAGASGAVTEQLAVAFSRLPSGTGFDMGVVVVDASGGADGAFTTQKVQ
jgi:hypothetical protein